MFIVSCDSMPDAELCYDIFVAYIEEQEIPWCQNGDYQFHDDTLTIFCFGKLQYIFIATGYEMLFSELIKRKGINADVISADEFFENFNEYYYF